MSYRKETKLSFINTSKKNAQLLVRIHFSHNMSLRSPFSEVLWTLLPHLSPLRRIGIFYMLSIPREVANLSRPDLLSRVVCRVDTIGVGGINGSWLDTIMDSGWEKGVSSDLTTAGVRIRKIIQLGRGMGSGVSSDLTTGRGSAA